MTKRKRKNLILTNNLVFMEKAAIILVNYKDYAERFLMECRDSLRNQTYPKEDYQVYIIDNAASSKSRNFLENCFPEAKVLPREDGNYSAANNLGIKKAREDGFKNFIVANMDTKFDEHWLEELIKAVNSDERIGLAQSKILLYPKNGKEWNEPLINSLGNALHYLGFGYTSGYGKKNSDFPESEITDIAGYASGCSLAIKNEVLDKIGLYDEEYYMYHDDIELGWRVRLAGYRLVLAPASIVYHKYEFLRSLRMFYYMERNRYIAIFSFYRLATLFLLLPMLLFMDGALWFYSVINGQFLIKFKVWRYFFKITTWRHIFTVRKKVRKYRKLNDREILKNLTGKILFQEVANPLLKNVANPLNELYLKLIRRVVFW